MLAIIAYFLMICYWLQISRLSQALDADGDTDYGEFDGDGS
jgi:hypothetical protein